MKPLEQAILHTLIYFDLFDYAPTALEIDRWLLQFGHADPRENAPTLSQIMQVLDTHPRIEACDGFYMLRGRNELARLRKQKYLWTDEKWKHARPFLRLLAMMPHVQAVWLANSVAWGNASKNSDTDVIIVTRPNRIWTARFFTTLCMRMLRQRPGEQTQAKAICLSFYMTADPLGLEPYKIGKNDIHFSFWVTQVYPLYDPRNIYARYRERNVWVRSVFANNPWLTPIPRRRIQIARLEQLFKYALELLPGERMLQRLQWRWLPNRLKTLAAAKDPRVVITNTLLKFHDNDNRATLQQQWEQRTSMLE